MLDQPLTELPHAMLLDELVRTFGAKAGSWIDRQPGGTIDYHLWEPGVQPDRETGLWLQEHLDQHPLLCWFAVTADPAAQSIGRVPKSFIDQRYEAWDDVVGHLDIEHQMAVPLALQGKAHRAFVIVADGSDFSDEDLQLARRLQALLVGLDRQAQALARWMPWRPSYEAGLTKRELAVLGLVAEGLTAHAIARRLLISPRTVQKHLEHVYAKLRTTDRVSAVLTAQALGLLQRKQLCASKQPRNHRSAELTDV
ncbi:response regulator transcription factor [Lentzea sp. NPDC054927]